MRTLVLALSALCLVGAARPTRGRTCEPLPRYETMHWGPVPLLFPAGAEIAILNGDPTARGCFTAALSMPDGYTWPAHYHARDQFVAVTQGALIVRLGAGSSRQVSRVLSAGDTGTVPAGTRYSTVAKGSTVIAVTAVGPFDVTYVNPAQDPLYRPSFPF
jgi:quercetin dioxygenase-like cupin family protein